MCAVCIAANGEALSAVIAVMNLVWRPADTAWTLFLREPKTSRVIDATFAVALLASVGVAVVTWRWFRLQVATAKISVH